MAAKEACMIDLVKLLPKKGMAITIVNAGEGMYRLYQFTPPEQVMPECELTEADIEALRRGEVIFN